MQSWGPISPQTRGRRSKMTHGECRSPPIITTGVKNPAWEQVVVQGGVRVEVVCDMG